MNQSMLHNINTSKHKQVPTYTEIHEKQQIFVSSKTAMSNSPKTRQSLFMDRRRARSECLSPSRSPTCYQPPKSEVVKNNPDSWQTHRSSNSVEPDDNNISWRSRGRYRASSESSSDYYYCRESFPEVEDYRKSKRTRDSSSTPPGRFNRSMSHHHRVTNKSFSVLVNNTNHQYRYSPKLKAHPHYSNHKAALVRVSSPLHKKRIESWKSQSNSIASNSIPSIDSRSLKSKIDDDDDEDNDCEEDEEDPGPEDLVDVDDELTDPEDNYESSLSLSYSERSHLSTSTVNTASVNGGKVLSSPFAQSLFPFVPPYITFATFEEKGPDMPAVIHKQLKWKLTTITPLLVRKILLNTGFRLMKSEYKSINIDQCDVTAKHDFNLTSFY